MWPFGRGGIRRWLTCGRSSRNSSSSRVLVSVYVQPKVTPPARLSSASRRILLTTSIWSVFLVLIFVFVTYTVLLVAVDRPFSSRRRSHLSGFSAHDPRPRLKFLGRGVEAKNASASSISLSSRRRTPFWDPAQLHDGSAEEPECRQGSLFVVLVTSAPTHFEHRREIRHSWCDPSLSAQSDARWQCVFLVGRTNDSKVSADLELEGRQHRDLLRGVYADSYRNLTHKVMHGLWWVASLCEAPYLLKTDDDCFSNTVLLRQFLLHHNTQTSSLYAGGMVVRKEKRKVIRRENEKWAVSLDDYLPEYYPMYASGSGYILSFDVASKAVKLSRYIKPIPNEDAYMGIVMDRLQVAPKLSGRFTLSSSGLRVCNYLYIFVAHGVAPSMQREMCQNMMAAQRDCRSKEKVTDW